MQAKGHPDVLLISRKWPPSVGGMERCTYELAQRLAEKRALEAIVLPGRSDGAAPGALAISLFGLATAVRLLVRGGAPIVHVADIASWPLGWIASLRHRRRRIVLSAHGSDLSYALRGGWRAQLYGAYVRFGAHRLPHATVIANSHWIAGLAKDAGWRSVVAVPLATSQATSTCPTDGNNALFFAGRIMPGKGLSFIVEQVLPLLDESIRVRVAGTVWDEDEERVLAHPRVDYLGRLEPRELAKEYRSALCVVVPSLGPEGFGLAAAEAAVAGGVVIASDHSGLAEAVLPQTGFLAESGAPEAWAERIRQIAAWSKQTRMAFTRRSSSVASKRFSWTRVVTDTLAVYDSDAEPPNPRRSPPAPSVRAR